MRPRYLAPVPYRLSVIRLCVFLAGLFVLFVSAVIGGAFQLYRYWPTLEADLHNTYYTARKIPAHRGNIYDRNKRPLAMNTDEYHAVAELRILRDTRDEEGLQKLAGRLAEVLKISPETMEKKLSSQKDFAYLKKNISPEIADQLQQMNIKGVRSEYKSQRFYPNGQYFAHLVGYTDYRGLGRSGVESFRNAYLASQSGEEGWLRTSQGASLDQLYSIPAKDGQNLRLAIDSRLQYFSYQALQQAVTKHDAAGGAVIVMDVKTGGLLSIANYPSFNPNNILRADERLRNRALADVVEPGSTAKPFVVAVALESNLTKATEVLPTHKQPLKIGKLLVKDSHIREPLDIAGVISKSSNVGAVLLASRVGKEPLWKMYNSLGFGGEPILSLPEERSGELRHYKKWRREDFATHAYGYGFSTTLLQLLAAYSIFATDGMYRHPLLEKGDYYRHDYRALSAKTARQVRKMMEQVTSPDGTAKAAAIAGYRVAGKTGTTYKWDGEKYNSKKLRAFFVGMAPASQPRYLIAVMVDEPRHNGQTGGAVAAPVFRQIMEQALLLGGVAPDLPLTFPVTIAQKP